MAHPRLDFAEKAAHKLLCPRVLAHCPWSLTTFVTNSFRSLRRASQANRAGALGPCRSRRAERQKILSRFEEGLRCRFSAFENKMKKRTASEGQPRSPRRLCSCCEAKGFACFATPSGPRHCSSRPYVRTGHWSPFGFADSACECTRRPNVLAGGTVAAATCERSEQASRPQVEGGAAKDLIPIPLGHRAFAG